MPSVASLASVPRRDAMLVSLVSFFSFLSTNSASSVVLATSCTNSMPPQHVDPLLHLRNLSPLHACVLLQLLEEDAELLRVERAAIVDVDLEKRPSISFTFFHSCTLRTCLRNSIMLISPVERPFESVPHVLTSSEILTVLSISAPPSAIFSKDDRPRHSSAA